MIIAEQLSKSLELWGGIECTVNRVGDEYFDQLARCGHAERLSDLELFAELGIRAIRYPVLWERIAPDSLENGNWQWAHERLTRLRELQIRPIVGFVHHGSGPRHTSLVDPEFPDKLAEYARAVAERFPWIDAYTPVNEPLTTARFSGLYGHWYPHGRDAATFARTLLNQCRAIVLAMRAVRAVNPQAQLIQTEDLGKTHSTPALAYQAEFENERRWLSFDLLCGKVNGDHPLWNYLRHVAGVAPEELEWFVENPCPPDIIGINHYLTSERFLDERLECYPAFTHGGNHRQRYADVEAIRACAAGVAGPRQLLREAWERYQLPLAVTEVHLGCTREEQLRWFKQIWDAAQKLRAEGVDVRAVTAWALLGSFDWNSLLTRANGYYEPGTFDVRGGKPRPTALARMLKDLAQGREFEHPALDAPGWWQRRERLLYAPAPSISNITVKSECDFSRKRGARPLLISGATGTLGRAFARICEIRGLSYRLLSRREMDIADFASVERAITQYNPWAVINAAGFVRVDDAERNPERCFRENTIGAANLARACAQRGIAFVTFSSDLVFDGALRRPYIEPDGVAPLNVYGRSKAEAEICVLSEHPSALIIRTSAFFSPWDEYNFVTIALRTIASGKSFIAASDAIVSPTYVPDLVDTSLDLLIDGESGVWHLANEGAISWAEFARLSAGLAGLNPSNIEARSMAELKLVAPRPTYSALGSERGALLPSIDDAIFRYIRECEVVWKDPPRPPLQPENASAVGMVAGCAA